MSDAPILTALRTATRALHDATERYAYAAEIRDRTLRPEQLTDLLRKQKHLHRHFDERLARSASLLPFEHPLLPLLRTRRADWLPNFPSDASAPPDRLPPYASPAELVGALYVILGSSMGSRMIAKQLARTPTLERTDFRFYERMGEAGGREWRVFLDFLRQTPWTEAQIQTASQSARATFARFERVFREGTDGVTSELS